MDLTLLPEHRRGHGAVYDGLNHGRIDTGQLRTALAGLSLPRFDGGRMVLAVEMSPWLRSDAPRSADRLFCHVYARAKTPAQFIPGWPCSFVAALQPGATSWTAILDAVLRADRRRRHHRGGRLQHRAWGVPPRQTVSNLVEIALVVVRWRLGDAGDFQEVEVCAIPCDREIAIREEPEIQPNSTVSVH